jgi:hypothetical protein
VASALAALSPRIGPDATKAIAASAEEAAELVGGGEAGAEAAAAVINAATNAAEGVVPRAGMTAAQLLEAAADAATTAAELVASAAGVGGLALATNVETAVNMISLLHGSGAQMRHMADAVIRAFRFGGADAATAVVDAATATFGTAMFNQVSNNVPGNPAVVINTANAVADAAQARGRNAARAVVDAAQALARAGGTPAQIAAGAQRLAQVAINGGPDAARLVADIVRTTVSDVGVYTMLQNMNLAVRVAPSMQLAVSSAGPEAGRALYDFVLALRNTGANPQVLDWAARNAAAAAKGIGADGGATVIRSIADTTLLVIGRGGNAELAEQVVKSLSLGYNSGGQAVVDAALRAARIVAGRNGNANDLRDVIMTITQAAQNFANQHFGNPGAFADRIATAVENAARQPGARPDLLLWAAREEVDTFLPNVDLTTIDPPSPLGALKGRLDDSWHALTHDLQTGADKATIEKDAQQLARLAGQLNEPMLQKVALLAGSGIYKDAPTALKFLQLANQPGPLTGPPYSDPPLKDPMVDPTDNENYHNPLNDAYLQLEVDISNNADKGTIKTDAEQVKTLAGSDHPGLADAANNISKSIDIDDGSYDHDQDHTGSLTALMNNPPNAAPTTAGGVPPPPPPSVPEPTPPIPQTPQPPSVADETTPYQKLLADIESGADQSTLLNDSEALFKAAIHNGDFGLSQAALDIGESVKTGPFDKDTTTKTLTGAAPGTSGARLPPAGDGDWTPPPPNAPAT